MDAGERPYVYYFPYLKCPHSMNAIDKTIRVIWLKSEAEKITSKTETPSEEPPQTHPHLARFDHLVKKHGK